jgi:hypothetical protein
MQNFDGETSMEITTEETRSRLEENINKSLEGRL